VPADVETLVMERSKWRSLCKTSIRQFESEPHSSSGSQKRTAEDSNYLECRMLPMPNLMWTNICVENWAVLPLSNASTLTTIRDLSCRRPSPVQSTVCWLKSLNDRLTSDIGLTHPPSQRHMAVDAKSWQAAVPSLYNRWLGASKAAMQSTGSSIVEACG